MRKLLFGVAILVGAYAAAPISLADTQTSAGGGIERGQHSYAFRCPNNLLRIMFDGDRNIAEIHRFGRATVRLTAQAPSGSEFHFANATYDLQGTLAEVRFRVGQGEAVRCPRGSLNG
ncbi:MAG: hypothetical protein JSS00_04690 [Proteobacteria bacterium]|nr:hypothetical protein [Pseudomonadota bacterium]